MLSDSELLKPLHDVLQTADLDTATPATVRRALEQNLGIDLSDKKPYIRQQIDLYLQSHYNHNNEEQQIDNESENANENGGTVSDEENENEESDSDQNDKVDSKRNKTTPNAKKRGGGFAKPCALSPQLEKLIGEPEMARTEVVKKIWAYIKEKDLQNPKNRRKILCDEMLHDIFRVKSIDMFQMNKVLSKHIWPIEEEDAAVKPTAKKKQNKRAKEEGNVSSEDEPNEEGKRQKTKGSGFTMPRPISEELMQFLGTDETELTRAEAVKRMWGYIKENDLQDPSDKRRILCDAKLKELFKVNKFVGFTVTKLLSPHFIKEKE